MKRMLALLMTLMLLLGLCACGAGSNGASGDTAASSSGGASNEMNSTDSGWDNGSTQDAPQESEGQSSASVYQDAKLIRRPIFRSRRRPLIRRSRRWRKWSRSAAATSRTPA